MRFQTFCEFVDFLRCEETEKVHFFEDCVVGGEVLGCAVVFVEGCEDTGTGWTGGGEDGTGDCCGKTFHAF